MAGEALQALGHVDQFPHPLVGLNQALEVGILFERLVERHFQFERHHLGDLVHLGVGHFHAPPGVANHPARQHGAERNDLRNVVAPVFLGDVLDDLASTVHAEIDVDIGQRDPLRIEESFEEQPVLKWIEIRNAHAIRHQAACGGTPAGPHRDFVLASVANEIPHDEKVPRVFHALDNADLFFEPRFVRGNGVFQDTAIGQRLQVLEAVLEAVASNFCEVGVDGKAGRDDELGERILHLLQLEAAALGDLHSLVEHKWDFSENPIHLLAALEVKLIGVELHPARIVDGLACLDAKQDVMRAAIVLLHVVAVVGGDRLDAGTLGNPQHVRDDLALLLQTVIVDFEEEAVLAKDVMIFGRRLFRLLDAAAEKIRRDFAVQTCGKANQSLAVLAKQFLVDTGLVVKTVEVSLRHQLDEVLISRFIFAKNDQVVRPARCGIAIEVARLRDIHLAADDRLDSGLLGRVIKADRAEQISMVGDRDSRLISQILSGGDVPLLGQEGWTRHQENAAKPPLKGADGVVSSAKHFV